MILASSGSHAETVFANASVTVAEACTMTATVNSAHSATINPGQYLQPIGETILKVICNDAGGFSIYAVGNANNEYGNNKLLANVGGSLNSTYDIATGTATSGSTSNWAMKVSAVAGTYAPTIQNSFNNYHDVPTTYTKVAQLSSATDTTTGSSVSTTYAAYVKSDQPAGNYNGKVKYTMVHPASEVPAQPQTTESGKICYYANASDAVGTMGCQNVSSSVMLLASNFSRTGYGFAGWSDVFDYQTNENAKFYGPQETITLTPADYQSPNNGLSLYAVWVKSAGNLQDTNKVSELCGTGTNALTAAPTDGTANLDSVSALTDQRDNNTYAIAKLADGNCWMIENLRLEAEDTRSDADKALAQGYGTSSTYGNFSGLADAESTGFTSAYTANSLYYSGTQEGTASIDIGTSNYPSYRMPRYNNWNNQSTSANRPQNPTTNWATNSTTNAGMYSYGNYYTWLAAIADTTYYSSGDHNTTSICPTGWQLPLGGTSTGDIAQGAIDTANKVGGFSYLDRKIGGTGSGQTTAAASLRWRTFPNNFLYSGYFYTSSAGDRGSRGNYWSSTAESNSSSYYLDLRSSSRVVPGSGINVKSTGHSIRCTVSAGT